MLIFPFRRVPAMRDKFDAENFKKLIINFNGFQANFCDFLLPLDARSGALLSKLFFRSCPRFLTKLSWEFYSIAVTCQSLCVCHVLANGIENGKLGLEMENLERFWSSDSNHQNLLGDNNESFELEA